MKKYTPGPWNYYHTGTGIDGSFRIETADGIFIARTSYCEDGKEAKMIEPDAKLIAAAPEMLEALEFITACFKGQLGNLGEVQRAGLMKSLNAIAKAKGE